MLDDVDEAVRLGTLRSYSVLDTPPEAQFDDLVREAAQAMDAPIALLSLVDEDRQWFKARVGLAEAELGRSISFCTHAIRGDDVFVVEDTSRDKRFVFNPLVVGHPHIRFYAGAPLTAPNGSRIGALCVIDTKPRNAFSAAQKDRLEALARRTMLALDERKGACCPSIEPTNFGDNQEHQRTVSLECLQLDLVELLALLQGVSLDLKALEKITPSNSD